jgi:hypothetical protein
VNFYAVYTRSATNCQGETELVPFIAEAGAEARIGFDEGAGNAVPFRHAGIEGSGKIGDYVVLAFEV